MFFGRDLLKSQPAEGRALLNHNRDIGLLTHDRLVVLGLMQTVEFYQGDPKVVDMSLLAQPTEADREIEKDAIAIYQVADDLTCIGVTGLTASQPRSARAGRSASQCR